MRAAQRVLLLAIASTCTPSILCTPLFPLGSVWLYNDNTAISIGSAWAAVGPSDSIWLNSTAPFGFSTNIGIATNITAGASVFYFVQNFTSTQGATVNVTGNLTYSAVDGAVLYVNGQEVDRNNLPVGTLSAASTPLICASNASRSNVYTASVPAGVLTAGTNAVAVAVFVCANTTGLLFDMQGSYTVAPSPTPSTVSASATAATPTPSVISIGLSNTLSTSLSPTPSEVITSSPSASSSNGTQALGPSEGQLIGTITLGVGIPLVIVAAVLFVIVWRRKDAASQEKRREKRREFVSVGSAYVSSKPYLVVPETNSEVISKPAQVSPTSKRERRKAGRSSSSAYRKVEPLVACTVSAVGIPAEPVSAPASTASMFAPLPHPSTVFMPWSRPVESLALGRVDYGHGMQSYRLQLAVSDDLASVVTKASSLPPVAASKSKQKRKKRRPLSSKRPLRSRQQSQASNISQTRVNTPSDSPLHEEPSLLPVDSFLPLVHTIRRPRDMQPAPPLPFAGPTKRALTRQLSSRKQDDTTRTSLRTLLSLLEPDAPAQHLASVRASISMSQDGKLENIQARKSQRRRKSEPPHASSRQNGKQRE